MSHTRLTSLEFPVNDRDAFAAAHLPGSLNIELNSGFASYVGWMLPFDTPIVLIVPEPEDKSVDEAVTQLVRIGWSQVTGWLPGGIPYWRSHGGELATYDVVRVDDLCRAQRRGERPVVLDVRQELEWGWAASPAAGRSSSPTCRATWATFPVPNRSG